MATAIRRIANEVISFGSDVVSECPLDLRIGLLVLVGLFEFGPTLTHASSFIFEDSSGLPWTGPITYAFKVQYWIWSALKLTEPWQYHLLNLSVHALTAIMVGLAAGKMFEPRVPVFPPRQEYPPSVLVEGQLVPLYVTDQPTFGFGYSYSSTRNIAWACGSIFWLHPLAIPAVGYASALPEMLVCLGSVTLTWTLLQDRTWYWFCAAALILFITLNVKSSAIGVLLMPAVTVIVRPIRWRDYWGLVGSGVFLAIGVALLAAAHVGFVRSVYPWHRWPEEMLPMAAQAFTLATQSILPLFIAFQLDPVSMWLGAWAWMLLVAIAVIVWLTRDWHRVGSFAILYVLALITVRLVVPTSNWLDRAPEMWYTQQWYPALPGMVWLLVSLFAPADASHAEPSAS